MKIEKEFELENVIFTSDPENNIIKSNNIFIVENYNDYNFSIYNSNGDCTVSDGEYSSYEIVDKNILLKKGNCFILRDSSFNFINFFEKNDSRFIKMEKGFLIFKDLCAFGNYSVFNVNGDLILDKLEYIPDFSDDFIIADSDKFKGKNIYDRNGNLIFSVNDENYNNLIIKFNNKKLKIDVNRYYTCDGDVFLYYKKFFSNKCILINDRKKDFIDGNFSDIKRLNDDLFAVVDLNSNKMGVINRYKNYVLEDKYDDINYNSKYNILIMTDNSSENSFSVYCYDIENNRKILLSDSCLNDDFPYTTEIYMKDAFFDEFNNAFFDYKDKKFYPNKLVNSEITSILSDGIISYMSIDCDSEKCGLYNYKNNNFISSEVFDKESIIDLDNYIIASKNGKYGVIDKNGKTILPFEYDKAPIYLSDNLFNINGNVIDATNLKINYNVTLSDDNGKVISKKKLDSQEKQNIIYEIMSDELNKSEIVTNNHIKTYNDLIKKYKSRRVSDFKRKFNSCGFHFDDNDDSEKIKVLNKKNN